MDACSPALDPPATAVARRLLLLERSSAHDSLSSQHAALQVLPDTGSWRTDRASVDAWALDPMGLEVWLRTDTRGGDPFSFAVQGPRVRDLEHLLLAAHGVYQC